MLLYPKTRERGEKPTLPLRIRMSKNKEKGKSCDPWNRRNRLEKIKSRVRAGKEKKSAAHTAEEKGKEFPFPHIPSKKGRSGKARQRGKKKKGTCCSFARKKEGSAAVLEDGLHEESTASVPLLGGKERKGGSSATILRGEREKQ